MLSEQQQKQLLADVHFLRNQVFDLQEKVKNNTSSIGHLERAHNKLAALAQQEFENVYKLLSNKKNSWFGRNS